MKLFIDFCCFVVGFIFYFIFIKLEYYIVLMINNNILYFIFIVLRM